MTPWTAACQASLSLTVSGSLLKLMSIEWVKPSNHLILYCPHLLLSSIFPSIRVFSSEPILCIRWPKDWSFSPSSGYSGLISQELSLQHIQIISKAQLKKRTQPEKKKKSAQGLNACFSKEVIEMVIKAHEKMLSITSSLRKANQIHHEVSPHIGQNGHVKNLQQ